MHWNTQYLPLFLALTFIGVLLGVGGIRFRLRFGHSPFHFSRWRDGGTAVFLSCMLVVVLSAIVLLTTAAALAPNWLARLDPLYRDPGLALETCGTLLILVGAALAWRGQIDMREAWRVGINTEERTRLVTRGLFQFCRNPIYLGLQLALVGFVALVPGCMSLALLGISLVLFQIQCRLEESQMVRQHGADYAEYCRRVGRFMPWTRGRSLPSAERRPGEFES